MSNQTKQKRPKCLSKNNLYSSIATNKLPSRLINTSCTTYFWTATKYTLEFKKDAAKLVIEKGYTHEQAADSLGISLSALGRWVRAERGPASVSAEKKSFLNLTDQAELIRLRKENEQLRMEGEILKKAAGIEAKEVE